MGEIFKRKDPTSQQGEPEDDEAVSILARRGDGGPEGHCGAFCIPFLVPRPGPTGAWYRERERATHICVCIHIYI